MEEESLAALDPDTGNIVGVVIGKTSYLMVILTYDLHSGGNLQFEESRKLGCVVIVAKHF